MSYSEPEPPGDVPAELTERLTEADPETLREVAQYATELAEYREREARLSESDEDDDRTEDTPDDVPQKATITVKEINDNRYYYWQWRDGDQIKSKYKGPVNPDESS